MIRLPNPFEMQARQAEHDERVRRVLALDVRYGPGSMAAIVDRDPGDEDDASSLSKADRERLR